MSKCGHVIAGIAAAACLPALTGCTTTEVAYGTAGAAVLGGQAPGNEIEQVYYMGVFDPRDQLKPPSFYRIRVHGQASAISKMSFGSGWVRSDVIDSLSPEHQEKINGATDEKGKAGSAAANAIKTGRGLVMFGPEGFRPAPRNHRLVIVMGASPEAFFQAVDQSLGLLSEARVERLTGKAQQKILEAMVALQNQAEQLRDVEDDAKREFGGTGGS